MLETKADEDDTPVWLLLSKHITRKEENKDFISLLIFSTDSAELKRIYYPDDPISKGYYINSPHYLVRIKVPKGITRRVLVISQVEKVNDLKMSLSAFSFGAVTMKEIPKIAHFEDRLTSEWVGETAGGNSGHPGYFRNPAFRIKIHPGNTPAKLLLTLEAPKVYSGNIKLYKMPSNGDFDRSFSLLNNPLATSGSYRPGFSYVEVENLDGLEYVALVSTFKEHEEGKFFFTAASNHKVEVSRMHQEGEGMRKIQIDGKWIAGVNNFGCTNHGKYEKNQRYGIFPSETTSVIIRVTSPIDPGPSMNISLFSPIIPGVLGNKVIGTGDYTNAPYGMVLRIPSLPPAMNGHVFIPSTFDPISGPYTLTIYSKAPIAFQELSLEGK